MVPEKIQRIICTGNACDQASYNYLKAVCPDIDIVLGDYDEYYLEASSNKNDNKVFSDSARSPKISTSYPNSKVIEIEEFKIGIIHGHQLVPGNGDVDTLVSVARHMGVDVLCSGNTHRFEAYEEDNRFFVNPGSATGAYSAYEHCPIPSFVLMDLKENNITAYVYQLVDGEVKIDSFEYSKQ
ncbi:Vacuolar protein sorting-associated protein 29 [Smittium mucronatum]|uniref:Vacuolar protein sorting-associated protein 29 n=1 Tax=Smittium mucronatum TaxID=133383 RepID=A0A1R0GLZ6_9FUNG|nr:Vacuolar protein sorting-associated protein 29 [Smittium mucronatum]